MTRKRHRMAADCDRFGFRWDQVDVIRYADHNGCKWIGIETDRQIVQVWVTKTGFIRVSPPQRQQKVK